MIYPAFLLRVFDQSLWRPDNRSTFAPCRPFFSKFEKPSPIRSPISSETALFTIITPTSPVFWSFTRDFGRLLFFFARAPRFYIFFFFVFCNARQIFSLPLPSLPNCTGSRWNINTDIAGWINQCFETLGRRRRESNRWKLKNCVPSSTVFFFCPLLIWSSSSSFRILKIFERKREKQKGKKLCFSDSSYKVNFKILGILGKWIYV